MYAALLRRLMRWRWPLAGAYVVVAALLIWLIGGRLGWELFPTVDSGQFQLRLRAADGTRIETTEEIALQALALIKEEAGPDNVAISAGYVGLVPTAYTISAIHQWMRGPEEAFLRVVLRRGSGVKVSDFKEKLRQQLPARLGDWLRQKLLAEALPADKVEAQVRQLRLSFEPGDIINTIMSFGSPTPVEVAVSGRNMQDNRTYAGKVFEQLARVSSLRDLQIAQSLDYPAVEVRVDRERAGLSGVTAGDVSRSLVAATSSSRFVVLNFWADPATGIGYQVQVEVPPFHMDSPSAVGQVPIKNKSDKQLLVRDVASVREGTMPGEYDRYNMRRVISMTANIEGADLGRVAQRVQQALAAAGEPPRGVEVDVRGQIEPFREMFRGLALGLSLAIVVIFLLLTAYFQSLRLALASVAAAPAVLAGVAVMLWATDTTLNIQSFMGAIMAIGVAVSNAILLVTFAEEDRRLGRPAREAAVQGASSRLRPILMTSCAMLAGMMPMALALGEGGQQMAPLGRAVIGGLSASTLATLTLLPMLFAVIMGDRLRSASLDPDDPTSPHYAPEGSHE